MANKEYLVVEQDADDTWAAGIKWCEESGFQAYETGFATREAAEARLPAIDEQVERELAADFAEYEAREAEENKQFPNIGYIRARIAKIKDLAKRLDADDKLSRLLDMDLHEHIQWPLPSWKAIESGRVYGR
jgi:hypothetical protein